MAKLHATVKFKDFRLKSYIKMMRLVSYISLIHTQRMYDWLFENIDKFYTIEM